MLLLRYSNRARETAGLANLTKKLASCFLGPRDLGIPRGRSRNFLRAHSIKPKMSLELIIQSYSHEYRATEHYKYLHFYFTVFQSLGERLV